MITINKSETADTRTCDVSKVTREVLVASSLSHIKDVQKALSFFADKLVMAGLDHDYTRINQMDQFFSDFKTKFKETTWYENHKREERHHLIHPEGVREDVDMIDVLEYISDCVMVGMARSGSVYDITLSSEVLQKAFKNTVDKLKANVKVVDGSGPQYSDYRMGSK